MRKYGWIPDLPDQRDHVYRPKVVLLPEKVDLRFHCSPVEDQETIGSCTAQAFAGILEYIDRLSDAKHTDVSRLFIYYNERLLEGTTGEDSGAYIRDGIKSLVRWGACDEYLWPYKLRMFNVTPAGIAYEDGVKRRIQKYQRITDRLYGVKSALASGNPVVFGFSVYQSFNRIGSNGVMAMPGTDERLEGGHAVLAVGYDDAAGHLIIRNSWGAGWGDKGYFYMPYSYVENENLSDDFWIITERQEFTTGEDIEFPVDTKWYFPFISIIQWIVDRWEKTSRGK